MGDSEAVTEKSAAVSFNSAKSGQADTAMSDAIPEAGSTAVEPSSEAKQASGTTFELNSSNFGDGSVYSGDPSSVQQHAQFNSTDGIVQTGADQTSSGNTTVEYPQAPEYTSSVNGPVANATGLENGSVSENVDGPAAGEKHLSYG